MGQSNTYHFVGGKRDGNEFPVPGHVQVGTIIRLQMVADPSRAELYQMGTDGKFHFVTYAWTDSDAPRAPGEAAAAAIPAAHLQSLLQQLAGVLKELNDAFIARGEFPRGIQVNGWVMQRKEAVNPPSPPPAPMQRRSRNTNPRHRKNPPRD